MHCIFTNRNLRGYTNGYEFYCTQLVLPEFIANGFNASGERVGERWRSTNSFGLDTAIVYTGNGYFGTNNAGDAVDSPSFFAAPNAFLLPIKNLQQVRVNHSFQTYLFFQPFNGIPVAVKRIDWSLFMQATNSGASDAVDVVVSPSNATVSASNVEQHGNPEWLWGVDAVDFLVNPRYCTTTNFWFP
jgi:hypothetical protein